MSILNHSAISGAYFFPQLIECEEAVDVEVNCVRLHCLSYRPNPNLPTLV